MRNEEYWEQVEEAAEYLLEKEFETALKLLRDVIQNHPSNPYAYNYLGVAFFELKQYEAAKDAYVAATKLAPDYLGARISLSHSLRLLGRIEEAIIEAKESLEQSPEDGDALHAAGLAYASKGNIEEAREYLEKFLKTNPEFEASIEARQVLAMMEEKDPEDKLKWN